MCRKNLHIIRVMTINPLARHEPLLIDLQFNPGRSVETIVITNSYIGHERADVA